MVSGDLFYWIQFKSFPSGSVPFISRGIENIVVKRGKSFNLTCIFAGQVGIEVTWKMNGNPLSTTEIISISNSVRDSAYVTSLLFRRISMAENGNTFSCTANYPGVAVQTVSTAQITVDGKVFLGYQRLSMKSANFPSSLDSILGKG